MSLEARSPEILRFGVFEVDVRAGELRKQGVRIKLQEQPFHVLTVLLQRPGEVVTREELRSQNWPADTFVDFDNSLNTAINKLREALGDSADNPRFIETLPRRGYRFIAPVTGVDGTAKGTATGVSAAASALSRKIVVTAAVVMLAAGIAGGLLWRARQARHLTEKDTIVLADFANTTGDAVFDDTLKQGLRVQLEQSPFLNILSERKVAQSLTLMGRSPEQRLTPELARDLCQRVGSKATLTGTISSLGTRYVIGLNAVNCETGDTLASEQVEADSREHVLRALSESATSLRRKLGESLATVEKYDAPVGQATTPSLEALKAYSLGSKTWNAKGGPASIPFFKRALELDPNFALAYARLGMAYAEVDENALSIENIRKAYELRAKVSNRERLYIESHYYHFVTEELGNAAQVYELWEQIYPRDSSPHDNLQDIYSSLGNHEKALEDALETLRLWPNGVSSYEDVSRSYLRLNRLDEAEAAFKQAEEHKRESGILLAFHYQLAFLKGDAGEMARLQATAAGKVGGEDFLLSAQADSEAYHGHLTKAREFSRRAAESARHADAKETAALWQANAALREAEFGNAASARQYATAALALAPGRSVEVLAALALARAGDVARAQSLASKLNKDFPLNAFSQNYWLPAIRAAIELNHKNPTRSIELLQAAASYELGDQGSLIVGTMYPVYLRGQAHLLAHQAKEAAAEFQKIIDHPGVVVNFPLGALAHLQLGRAYALQDDAAKARAAYLDFLALWKDADPDIPILQQAKAEYAKLQ